MGGGAYSTSDRLLRSTACDYVGKSSQELFVNRNINSAMNPYGVTIRESRDSAEHPNSVAILLGLDVTGSMGSVPTFLVKQGLPELMDSIIKGGVADPQLLFMGIGDHECDRSPLQVGQFESSDALLDHWLTNIYLEGGGGGNGGESYMLAWYFAGRHTATDCFEKRGRKGYCITVGDEPNLRSLPAATIKGIMGPGEYQSLSAAELLDSAQKTFNVYHVHIGDTSAGADQKTVRGWQEMLGANLVVAQRRTDVADIIRGIVLKGEVVERPNGDGAAVLLPAAQAEDMML